MLTVTNLSIRTKQTKETLVRSVSFSVKSGEALGLIGAHKGFLCLLCTDG